jgi:hypothetical protein
MRARKVVFICLLFGSLLTARSFGQPNSEWAIKPPTKTYPVDPSTSATLKSVSDDSVALVLSVKPEHISLPKPQDVASLSIYLDVGDAALQIEPTKWNNKREMVSPAGIKIEFAFDGDAPISDLWGGGSGAAFLTDDNSRKFTQTDFINRLRKAKILAISYTLHGGIRKTASFDVSHAETAIAAITDAGWHPQSNPPSNKISPDMIAVGKAMFALMPEVADPKTHDGAVAKLDKVKAAVKESAPDSDADAAVLNDLLNLYTFATYMYDTRDHWIGLDPQIRTHPQNLLLLRPYSDCWQKVRSELETGVAMGGGNVGCDLSVIGEH